MRRHRLALFFALVIGLFNDALAYTMPSVGFASMTHYYLPM
jgi:hypothetical protein